jgi:hypothetical protein
VVSAFERDVWVLRGALVARANIPAIISLFIYENFFL